MIEFFSIGFNREGVYHFRWNEMRKTESKSYFDYFSVNYEMTHKTIELGFDDISDVLFQERNQINILDVLEKRSKSNQIFREKLKAFHVFDEKNGSNGLFITSDDKVYCFGSNFYGCCDLGHNNYVDKPEVIPELCDKNIKQSFIGYDFYLALNSEGQIFGWGRNCFGQLAQGFDCSLNEYMKPHVIEFSKIVKIEEISCGSRHTLILTDRGDIYGWGNNALGQIGCGKDKNEKVTMPIKIDIDSSYEVQSIFCSFDRSFALTSNGLVYSWGENLYNCLGYDSLKDQFVFEPKLIDISNVKCISFFGFSTYFLKNDGSLYFCGFFEEKNDKSFSEKLPVQLKCDIKFNSLYFAKKYKDRKPIAFAMSDENVYQLSLKSITKTKYKSIFDYYTKEHKITDKTVYMSQHIWAEEESVFTRKHFEILDKLDSGSFGQVFKVEHQLDNQFYAIKSIKLPGNKIY